MDRSNLAKVGSGGLPSTFPQRIYSYPIPWHFLTDGGFAPEQRAVSPRLDPVAGIEGLTGLADIVDRQRRSEIMSRIGPKNTAPELAVRSAAHRLGLRFRLHRKELPGSPDLVLAKHNTAVFVHGCFWHRHAGCANATTPKTRPEFWQKKFDSNVARDERNKDDLTHLGWRSMVIWECETEDQVRLERILRRRFVARHVRCSH